MTRLTGGCHCGAVGVVFETSVDPAELQVRACQCGFCRRHGGKSVSDPAGRLTLRFSDDAVLRYRFGSRTADFLVCRGCGDYIAALMEDRAVLNVVAADIADLAARAPDPVTYDAETPDQKVARRRARWTPTVVEPAR